MTDTRVCKACGHDLYPAMPNLRPIETQLAKVENPTLAKEHLLNAKQARQNGKFAMRVIGEGHRSESALQDLLAYTKQLEDANTRHVIHHIENICGICGHSKTEDGCANCLTQSTQPQPAKAEREIGDKEMLDWIEANADKLDIQCNLAFSTPFLLVKPVGKVGEVIHSGQTLRQAILSAMSKEK